MGLNQKTFKQIKPGQIAEIMEMIRKESAAATTNDLKTKTAREFFAATEKALKFKAATNEKYKVFA